MGMTNESEPLVEPPKDLVTLPKMVETWVEKQLDGWSGLAKSVAPRSRGTACQVGKVRLELLVLQGVGCRRIEGV